MRNRVIIYSVLEFWKLYRMERVVLEMSHVGLSKGGAYRVVFYKNAIGILTSLFRQL